MLTITTTQMVIQKKFGNGTQFIKITRKKIMASNEGNQVNKVTFLLDDQ